MDRAYVVFPNDTEIKVFTKPRKNGKSFGVPSQEKELCEFLLNFDRYYDPNNTNSRVNLTLLKANMKNMDWLLDYLSTIFRDKIEKGDKNVSAAKLHSWVTLLDKVKLDDLSKFVKATLEALRVLIANSNTDSLNENLLKFRSIICGSNKSNSLVPITSINLPLELISSISNSLGQEYSISEIMNTETLKEDCIRYRIHENLAGILLKRSEKKIDTRYACNWSNKEITHMLNPSILQNLKDALQEYNSYIENRPPTKTTSLNKIGELNSKLESKVPRLEGVAKCVSSCFLSAGDHLKMRGSEATFQKIINSSTLSLDEWQRKMVLTIRESNSVLVSGPTSGGKTFASMAVLEWMFQNKKDSTVVYVAPNFYQAFQAYVNIAKTFPKDISSVGLITGVVNVTPSEALSKRTDVCHIIVGTPSELHAYFDSRNEGFSIGIFDEIHTISIENKSPDSLIRAQALAELLSKCTKQVIALSATINDEDIKKLVQYISDSTEIPITNIKTVIYPKRPVSLSRNIYHDNSLFHVFTTNNIDFTESNENIDLKEVEINAENTLNLLNILKNHKIPKLPVLVFDENDGVSYNSFKSLVNHLENKRDSHYEQSNKIYNKFRDIVHSFNSEINSLNQEDKDYQVRSSNLISMRRKITQDILQTLKKKLMELIESQKIVVPIKSETISENISTTLRNLTSLEVFDSQWVDLVKEIMRFQNSHRDSDNLILLMFPCENVGSCYCFSENLGLTFSSMIQTRNEPTSVQKFMRELCDAESARIEDIDLILKLLDRGLKFGIGILLPTMPYAVQHQMMLLLKQEKLKVVFASQALSMGINFPIKSVVVRSETLKELNTSEILQMEGRAGRRRKEDFETGACSILWNVKNFKDRVVGNIEFPPIINKETIAKMFSEIDSKKKVIRDLELKKIVKTSPKLTEKESSWEDEEDAQVEVPPKIDENIVKEIEKIRKEITSIQGDIVKRRRGFFVRNLEEVSACIEETRLISGNEVAIKEATKRLVETRIKKSLKAEVNMDDEENTNDNEQFEDYADENEEDRESSEVMNVEKPPQSNIQGEFQTCIMRIVNPIAKDIGLSSDVIAQLQLRINLLCSGEITCSLQDNPYFWADKINLVKRALQEIYTVLMRKDCRDFLSFITKLYELLHRVSFRQLRIGYN